MFAADVPDAASIEPAADDCRNLAEKGCKQRHEMGVVMNVRTSGGEFLILRVLPDAFNQ